MSAIAPRAARRCPLTALALAAALLAACGAPDEQALVASARSFLERQDTAAAIIQLKTALQARPDSAAARLLLGQALLEQGQPVDAALELRKAAALGADADLALPPLARAMLAQGQADELVAAHAGTRLKAPEAAADLKTSLAVARLTQGRREEGAAVLEEALALAPRHARALVVKARFALARSDPGAALAVLQEALAADPRSTEALLLQAEALEHGTGQAEQALAAYRRAAEIDPRLAQAHQGLVSLLLKTGRRSDAQAHVTALVRSAPGDPGTRLLQAQMAFVDGRYAQARELAEPLLRQAGDHPLVLQVAGAAAYHLRDLAVAEVLLARALKRAPGSPLARLTLARTQLAAGDGAKAVETLEPMLAGPTARADALTLAGEAHLHAGQARQAEEMFARAVALAPGDARARTALALGQIGRGQTAGGLAALEALADRDPGTLADMALLATRLRRGDTAGALRALVAVERKQPRSPVPALLRGQLLARTGDTGGARASFERALALEPGFYPAVSSLARLDVAARRPEAARQRLQALLEAQPRNHRALVALADLADSQGSAPAEVAAVLEQAVRAAPAQAAPRLRLVALHLDSGDAPAALTAAQQAAAALPASREVLAALGRAELANEAWQQALGSYTQLAALPGAGPAAQLGLAQAQLGLKDDAAAQASLRRALEQRRDLLPAQAALVALLARQQRHAEALAVAREVQKQRPQEAAGYLLEGDVERQRRQWDAALAAYRDAARKAPRAPEAPPAPDGAPAPARSREATAAPRMIHTTLREAGREAEAETFAAAWLREHPRDIGFGLYRAGVALAAQDWAQAESRYRDVLRVAPDHAVALNNVAWLMLRQGKPGALPFAEQALAAAPASAALMDTLAAALAAQGQTQRALEVQQRAVARAPGQPGLRLHLARLLVQAGQKKQARAELEHLRALGDRFAEQPQVRQLLESL